MEEEPLLEEEENVMYCIQSLHGVCVTLVLSLVLSATVCVSLLALSYCSHTSTCYTDSQVSQDNIIVFYVAGVSFPLPTC